MSPTRSRLRLLVPVLALSLLAAACGSSGGAKAGADNTNASGEKVTLRLGYFPNVTHAPAMVGLQDGQFASALGSNVTLKTSVFNAGPAAVEALFSKSIDASFVGPNPAINAYSKSKGAAIRSRRRHRFGRRLPRGAARHQDGRRPQGQEGRDAAARQHRRTSRCVTGSSRRACRPTPKAAVTSTSFPPTTARPCRRSSRATSPARGCPEPYATKLVDAGGHILVDERDLWPDGKYVTTLLVVRTEFLNAHPDVVTNLIKGLSASIDLITSDPAKAAGLVSKGIEAATSKPLAVDLVTKSFKNITFTLDPIASSLRADVEHAVAVGTLDATDIKNIFDLTLLNKFLTSEGKETVKS